MTASFRINQATAGTYGLARQDLAVGSATLEAESTLHTTYLWELTSEPEGSTSSIVGTGSSVTLNLSITGGFLVRLIVDQGLPTEDVMELYAGVPLTTSGLCIPAFNETVQDNSESSTSKYGYERKLSRFFRYVDTNIGGTSVWDRTTGTPDYLSPVTATDVIRVGDAAATDWLQLEHDGTDAVISSGTNSLKLKLGTAHLKFSHQGGPFIETQDIDNTNYAWTFTHNKTSAGAPAQVYWNVIGGVGTAGASFNVETTTVVNSPSAITIKSLGGHANTYILSESTTGASGNAAVVTVKSKSAAGSTVSILAEGLAGSGSPAETTVSATNAEGDASVSIVADGQDDSYIALGDANTDTIRFRDANTNWETPRVHLSNASSEWSSYASNFGEVSLFNAINQAGTQNLQSAYDVSPSIAVNSTSGTVTLSRQISTGDVPLLRLSNYDTSTSTHVFTINNEVDPGGNWYDAIDEISFSGDAINHLISTGSTAALNILSGASNGRAAVRVFGGDITTLSRAAFADLTLSCFIPVDKGIHINAYGSNTGNTEVELTSVSNQVDSTMTISSTCNNAAGSARDSVINLFASNTCADAGSNATVTIYAEAETGSVGSVNIGNSDTDYVRLVTGASSMRVSHSTGVLVETQNLDNTNYNWKFHHIKTSAGAPASAEWLVQGGVDTAGATFKLDTNTVAADPSQLLINATGGTAILNLYATSTTDYPASVNILATSTLTPYVSVHATGSSGSATTAIIDIKANNVSNAAAVVISAEGSTDGYVQIGSTVTDTVRFLDVNIAGASPSWTQQYLTLSDSSTEWDDFKSNFGEVSLLNAINSLYTP